MMDNEVANLRIAPSGLMDIANAAIYLGISVDSLRWIKRMRRVPFYKLEKRIMFSKGDLDEYLERRKVPAKY